MQSMNEIMPKQYIITRNGVKLTEGSDLGNMLTAFMRFSSEDGRFQLVDTKNNTVLSEKGKERNTDERRQE